jgi:hypothetical protein
MLYNPLASSPATYRTDLCPGSSFIAKLFSLSARSSLAQNHAFTSCRYPLALPSHFLPTVQKVHKIIYSNNTSNVMALESNILHPERSVSKLTLDTRRYKYYCSSDCHNYFFVLLSSNIRRPESNDKWQKKSVIKITLK